MMNLKNCLMALSALVVMSCGTTKVVTPPAPQAVIKESTCGELLAQVIDSMTLNVVEYGRLLLKTEKSQRDIVLNDFVEPLRKEVEKAFEKGYNEWEQHNDKNKMKLDIPAFRIIIPPVKGEIQNCFAKGVEPIVNRSFLDARKTAVKFKSEREVFNDLYDVEPTTDSITANEIQWLFVQTASQAILNKFAASIDTFVQVRDKDFSEEEVDLCNAIILAGLPADLRDEVLGVNPKTAVKSSSTGSGSNKTSSTTPTTVPIPASKFTDLAAKALASGDLKNARINAEQAISSNEPKKEPYRILMKVWEAVVTYYQKNSDTVKAESAKAKVAEYKKLYESS